MGRLIDTDKVIKDMQYYHDDCAQTSEYTRLGFETAIEVVKSARTVEAIPKADYENRSKADMVAMLTELQLEIEEKEQYYQDKFLESENGVHDLLMGGRMYGCGVCKELIQQKIDALREVEE